MKTPQDVMNFIKDKDIEIVDVKFTDVFGQWQHFSMPASEFDIETAFEDGMGFDGSSIRGFQSIEASDMILLADPSTAVMDPICEAPTLSLVCDIYDPISREPYSRDCRYVAKKAVKYLEDSGIADTVYMGPEAEFFVFDQVKYSAGEYSSVYQVDSVEGPWNSDIFGYGHSVPHKRGYFPVAPFDTLQDLRSVMTKVLVESGVGVEVHHHEVGTAGQCEIDMKYNTLVSMADQVQLYKYIVKNVAKAHGKTVTFMPKPIYADNGSGMHTHQSLWKDGQPLFAGDQYAGISEMALHYIGGILKHINSLLAIVAPTTNSYRRLVPGYEAPVVVAYSARNRSAAVRIPMYSHSPKAKRIEFRCPDPAANPYLAFSAMLMAGLDGIKNKIDPGDAADMDLFEEENIDKVTMTVGKLNEALDALEEDNDYLLEGGVFTDDLLDAYISYKRENEVGPVSLRPHPYEFLLYYGI
ncbi:MAG: type I glutamate--ammonia ligase [Candidatus Promineifilaceae bacterium]|nr:type I glutamate--ammonia ligase [Candidatus Promineifilaceae bacterium]